MKRRGFLGAIGAALLPVPVPVAAVAAVPVSIVAVDIQRDGVMFARYERAEIQAAMVNAIVAGLGVDARAAERDFADSEFGLSE